MFSVHADRRPRSDSPHSGIGESILVVNPATCAAFRLFVAEEGEHGRILGVDEMLLLQYLHQHPMVDTGTATALCHRSESEIRERLSGMESAGYIEHGGQGQSTYWCIQPNLYTRLAEGSQGDARRRIDWEAAKTRVLSILMERNRRGEPGLNNSEIRMITRFDRNKVLRLMTELRKENSNLQHPGRGRLARYEFKNDVFNDDHH